MHPDKEINVLEIFGRLGGSSIAVVGSCSCNITHNIIVTIVYKVHQSQLFLNENEKQLFFFVLCDE